LLQLTAPGIGSENEIEDPTPFPLSIEEDCFDNDIGKSSKDLKGISSSLCTHHIPMKQDHKHVREHQRRLNNAMREVVKKEVSGNYLRLELSILFLTVNGPVQYKWC
jgi:hypothetical protein